MVDAQIEPFAPAHHVGKELKLANRSGALALDTTPREPGLGARPVDESVPDIKDVGRDRLEKARPLIHAGLAIDVEGVPGQRTGSLDLHRSSEREGRLHRLASSGIDRTEGPLAALHPLRSDQNVTSDHQHTSQAFLVGPSESNVLAITATSSRVQKADRHRRIPPSARQLFDIPARSRSAHALLFRPSTGRPAVRHNQLLNRAASASEPRASRLTSEPTAVTSEPSSIARRAKPSSPVRMPGMLPHALMRPTVSSITRFTSG